MACFLFFSFQFGFAQIDKQPGSPDEPVRVLSDSICLDVHDGRLRPAIGVENIQVLRASRTQPNIADNYGWTYNHAPMLAYWNSKFYLQYLSKMNRSRLQKTLMKQPKYLTKQQLIHPARKEKRNNGRKRV